MPALLGGHPSDPHEPAQAGQAHVSAASILSLPIGVASKLYDAFPLVYYSKAQQLARLKGREGNKGRKARGHSCTVREYGYGYGYEYGSL
eukprot:1154771-Pelagomonas_calceolata.AAC.2